MLEMLYTDTADMAPLNVPVPVGVKVSGGGDVPDVFASATVSVPLWS